MSLLNKDQIHNKFASLNIQRQKNMDVYLIGSMSATRQASLNLGLSDVDLLFVPDYGSLGSYVSQFEQIMNIVSRFNQSTDQLIDAFVLSSHIVDVHFLCLSIIAGSDNIRDEDLILGTKRQIKGKSFTIPSTHTRKKLYIARAASFCREYIRLLPVADTRKARKTAKHLLRGLKMIICASTDANKLTTMEQKLFSVNTFDDIRPIITSTITIQPKIDNNIARALTGETVDDWPAWMIAQDTVARQLDTLGVDSGFTVNDRRLYDSICQVYTMLMIDLKNIINETDREVRNNLIDEYANTTASLIAKLALAGVASLMDFENLSTPRIITESYTVLVDHLKNNRADIRCLVSSVVLLEYSFEQSLIWSNETLLES